MVPAGLQVGVGGKPSVFLQRERNVSDHASSASTVPSMARHTRRTVGRCQETDLLERWLAGHIMQTPGQGRGNVRSRQHDHRLLILVAPSSDVGAVRRSRLFRSLDCPGHGRRNISPAERHECQRRFLRLLGPAVEERGIESIWAAEHVVLFDDYESSTRIRRPAVPGAGEPGCSSRWPPDYLAAVPTVRLGTGICLVPQRNPVYIAKQVADLDCALGGRAEFGIGVGWLEEEFDALNVPFRGEGPAHNESSLS